MKRKSGFRKMLDGFKRILKRGVLGLLGVLALALGGLVPGSWAATSGVTAAWNADATLSDGSTMTNLTQYTIYYATFSFHFTGVWLSTAQAKATPNISTVAVPSTISSQVTSRLIGGLNVQTTYYFRLTATNTGGGESGFNVDAGGLDVEVSTFVPVDTSSPTVTVTAPAPAALVSGSAVTVAANASDNVGVAGVQFQLDGANLGAEGTAAPYTITWNTTQAADGSHQLTAIARDGAGNRTTSAAVAVMVDNTPPLVSMTAPSSGATVSGTTVTVSANASDVTSGVAGVQFKLDGNNLGAEVTALPYSVLWNASAASAGSHTLTAVARDAAGNRTTSAAITVTVSGPVALSNAVSDRTFLSPGRGDGINDSAKFGTAAQEVTIFSLYGRQVFSGSQSSPNSSIQWDGHDGAGRVVGSGVYIARIRQSDGRVVYQRLVIVK